MSFILFLAFFIVSVNFLSSHQSLIAKTATMIAQSMENTNVRDREERADVNDDGNAPY